MGGVTSVKVPLTSQLGWLVAERDRQTGKRHKQDRKEIDTDKRQERENSWVDFRKRDIQESA